MSIEKYTPLLDHYQCTPEFWRSHQIKGVFHRPTNLEELRRSNPQRQNCTLVRWKKISSFCRNRVHFENGTELGAACEVSTSNKQALSPYISKCTHLIDHFKTGVWIYTEENVPYLRDSSELSNLFLFTSKAVFSSTISIGIDSNPEKHRSKFPSQMTSTFTYSIYFLSDLDDPQSSFKKLQCIPEIHGDKIYTLKWLTLFRKVHLFTFCLRLKL